LGHPGQTGHYAADSEGCPFCRLDQLARQLPGPPPLALLDSPSTTSVYDGNTQLFLGGYGRGTTFTSERRARQPAAETRQGVARPRPRRAGSAGPRPGPAPAAAAAPGWAGGPAAAPPPPPVRPPPGPRPPCPPPPSSCPPPSPTTAPATSTGPSRCTAAPWSW